MFYLEWNVPTYLKTMKTKLINYGLYVCTCIIILLYHGFLREI